MKFFKGLSISILSVIGIPIVGANLSSRSLSLLKQIRPTGRQSISHSIDKPIPFIRSNRAFSITPVHRKTLSENIAQQTDEIHALTEKLSKQAITVGDLLKGWQHVKTKIPSFTENFQLVDSEAFPRYLTGALGGLTGGGTMYMLSQHRLNAPKRDIQKLYELERRLQDQQPILTPEARQQLEKEVDMLRLEYLQAHGEEALKKQLVTMAAIEQLKKKMNGDQQNVITNQTPQGKESSNNLLPEPIKNRPLVNASTPQPQGWFSWGLDKLYSTPDALYTGGSYLAYPFTRAGTWAYSKVFSQ